MAETTRRDSGNSGGPAASAARDVLRICGLAAVRARFARDAGSIQRLYFDDPTGRKIGVMCKALAAARKIYRCVEPAELEKIAGTPHHGGVVAVVAPRALSEPSAADLKAWAGRREPVLVLDRVGNVHNLGAVARTAAFLGAGRLVLCGGAGSARPVDAAYRVAEGGLEAVELHAAPGAAAFVRGLVAAGYDVVGAATRGGRPDVGRAAGRPVALVMGNEEQGLDPAVAAACTRLVTIPGSGRVESLNVSVAAAILMWETWARRG
ncbi:MAG: hypothetical protein RLZZ188_1418 [Verrucomicrobiota bacterium]|jgi:RNA methyltransferase, TrmH family